MKPTAIKGAAIYGAASLIGAAFLPAGVAAVLIGKDSSTAEFQQSFERAYAASLDVVKKMGKLVSENKSDGLIQGVVSKAKVKVKIETAPKKMTKITVSARQFVLPKPEIAGGVLHEISQQLK